MRHQMKTQQRVSVIVLRVAVMLMPCCSAISAASSTYQVRAEPNDLYWNLGQGFDFAWDSGGVAFALAGAVSEDDTPCEPVPLLCISARLGILDVNDLVAMDVANPVVFGIEDGNGNPVAWQGAEPRPDDVRTYERVGRRWIQQGYSLVEKMMPSGFSLELPLHPNQPVPGNVAMVKGYIWALYSDGMIQVDVPFEPNGWIEPEQHPELTICVDPATPPRPGPIQYEYLPTDEPRAVLRRPTAPVQMYKYTTWVKSKAGTPVMGLKDSWYSPSVRASVEYVMIETRLFDSQKDVVLTPPGQSVISDAGRGANCIGSLQQCEYTFDHIRHIMAVHPVEVKIPFVLTSIPITSLPPRSR